MNRAEAQQLFLSAKDAAQWDKFRQYMTDLYIYEMPAREFAEKWHGFMEVSVEVAESYVLARRQDRKEEHERQSKGGSELGPGKGTGA